MVPLHSRVWRGGRGDLADHPVGPPILADAFAGLLDRTKLSGSNRELSGTRLSRIKTDVLCSARNPNLHWSFSRPTV